MRRLLYCSALALCLAFGGGAAAQDVQEDPAADEADPQYEPDQRGATEEEPGYEPDQRGATEDGGGESTGEAEPQYEPDQRGATGGGGGGGDGDDSELEEEAAPAPVDTYAESREAAADYGPGASYGRPTFGFAGQLWLGGGFTGLDTFEGDNLLRAGQASSGGASLGAMIGLRVGPVTLGPRLTFSVESGLAMGAVGLDVQLELASGRVVPTVRASVSYAFAFALSDALPSQNAPSGLWTELGGGARWYLGGPFVLGGDLSVGWLATFRDAVPGCDAPCMDAASNLDLTRDGSGHGFTFRLHLYGGVTF